METMTDRGCRPISSPDGPGASPVTPGNLPAERPIWAVVEREGPSAPAPRTRAFCPVPSRRRPGYTPILRPLDASLASRAEPRSPAGRETPGFPAGRSAGTALLRLPRARLPLIRQVPAVPGQRESAGFPVRRRPGGWVRLFARAMPPSARSEPMLPALRPLSGPGDRLPAPRRAPSTPVLRQPPLAPADSDCAATEPSAVYAPPRKI
ncbi:MAG: hypothetical protein LBR80_11130 [Deltaproteobacteria bacterium]|nr:hypothetical protein [Deltaproteobacteria bacterium]